MHLLKCIYRAYFFGKNEKRACIFSGGIHRAPDSSKIHLRKLGIGGLCTYVRTLRYVTLRYVTLRYVTLRYVTLRYVTVRYGTVRYGMVRYGTVRYCTVPYGTVPYGTVRYGTLRYRYRTVQYGTLRYATIRYGMGQYVFFVLQLRGANNLTALPLLRKMAYDAIK